MIVKAKKVEKTESFKGCDPKFNRDLIKVLSEYDILFQEPKGFPPKREIQREIHLLQDAPLTNIGMYRCLIVENVEIKKQVQELIERGVIRPSSSPCGSTIVLVPNKDGTWGMCVDYRALKKSQ